MRITFALSDKQHAYHDRSGILVGLPLTVQLDAGVMVENSDYGSWFQQLASGKTSLHPVSLDRHAFSGRITHMDQWSTADGVFCQGLVDCGLPLRFELFDPDQNLGDPGTPYGLSTGAWLVGVATLQGILGTEPGDLFWQPVEGAIVDLQRLCMDPLNPAFGTLRWLHGLPGRSFSPDLVYVTIEI